MEAAIHRGRELPPSKWGNAAGFDAKVPLDSNSILEARLGDAGPGGKPWIDRGKVGGKQLPAG